MVKKSDIPRHVIDTAMTLVARKGWSTLSMTEIAAEAKLSLADIHRLFQSKVDILNGLARLIDAEVLAGTEKDILDEAPRDRLFDILMRRFDALAPYKDAIRVIARDLRGDPLTALGSARQFRASMGWMLEAAGIDPNGPVGLARTSGLSVVWLQTLRIWLDDDTPDLSRTMAALDSRLRRAEQIAHTFRRRPRRTETDGPGDHSPSAA